MAGRKLLQKLKDRPIYIVILLIIMYATYFSCYTVLKHYTFQTSAYDLGIYMQSLWNTIHGHGLFYTTLWEGSRFASHFEPILFFIMPFYAAFPRAETLLVLQSILLAAGALPIYWIAKDELGKTAGVVFATLYLLYPALHGVNGFDFHGSALAIPFLLFCFYMFKEKRYILGIVFAVLAMMCKETVPLVVIFMGIYWFWEARRKSPLRLELTGLPREREVIYPLCLSLFASIWFIGVIHIVIPLFSPYGEFVYFGRYTLSLDSLLFDRDLKVLYLSYLLAPLVFTSLFHPVFLVALPILAQNLFAVGDTMYSIHNQHPSLLIPWIFIASIYGTRWLFAVHGKLVGVVLKRFLCLLLLSTVVTALLISLSPIKLGQNMPTITQHHKTLEKTISLIPEEASVYTQNDLFTHICHREHAYCSLFQVVRIKMDFFNYYLFPASMEGKLCHWNHSGDYDYILVDSTSEQSVLKWSAKASLDRLEREYGIYAQGDGVYLYKRGYEGEPLLLGQE